jgi:hypothetical protein
VTTISARCPAGKTAGWPRPLHRTPLSNPPTSSHVVRSLRVGVFWKFIGQVGVHSIRLVRSPCSPGLPHPVDYGEPAVAVALASLAPTLGDMDHGLRPGAADRGTAKSGRRLLGLLAFRLGIPAAFILFPRLGGVPRRSPNRTMVAVGAATLANYSVAFRG